jgi:hypothetical protein
MASSEMTIDGKERLSTWTIKIRWPRAFGFRMWLTTMLILAAGQVSPVKIDAVIVDDEAQDD